MQSLLTKPIECLNTKTKVITPTNHNRGKQPNEPIRIRSKYINRRQAREKAWDQDTISFGFGVSSHWLRKWCEFC